jgi:hypothetical protein
MKMSVGCKGEIGSNAIEAAKAKAKGGGSESISRSRRGIDAVKCTGLPDTLNVWRFGQKISYSLHHGVIERVWVGAKRKNIFNHRGWEKTILTWQQLASSSDKRIGIEVNLFCSIACMRVFNRTTIRTVRDQNRHQKQTIFSNYTYSHLLNAFRLSKLTAQFRGSKFWQGATASISPLAHFGNFPHYPVIGGLILTRGSDDASELACEKNSTMLPIAQFQQGKIGAVSTCTFLSPILQNVRTCQVGLFRSLWVGPQKVFWAAETSSWVSPGTVFLFAKIDLATQREKKWEETATVALCNSTWSRRIICVLLSSAFAQTRLWQQRQNFSRKFVCARFANSDKPDIEFQTADKMPFGKILSAAQTHLDIAGSAQHSVQILSFCQKRVSQVSFSWTVPPATTADQGAKIGNVHTLDL